MTYHSAEQMDLAMPLYRQALEITKSSMGGSHPETFSCMNNLASGYFAIGKIEEALQLLKETNELCRAHLGADHPDTLRGMNNLSEAYRAVGRFDEAISLGEKAFEQTRIKLDDAHPDTLTCGNNLAESYMAAERLEEAIDQFKAVLKTIEQHSQLEHLNGFEGLKNTQPQIPPIARKERLVGAIDRLIQFAEQNNDQANLENWNSLKAGLNDRESDK